MDKLPEIPTVLAVDLDGTLVRSDLTYETFWSAFAKNWTIPFVAALRLWEGRAALKQHLAERCRLDVATLPYNHDVLTYIHHWHANGGRTALVTGSHQKIADRIARHLGEFDEAYGSCESVNLKGARKASFLAEKFGAEHFAYIGDSITDLPVWNKAAKAITVNAMPALRARLDAAKGDVEHLPARSSGTMAAFQVMRPHQWTKNLLVFVPMLAAHQFTLQAFIQSVLALIAFCLAASSAYVLNDLLDLAADRAHPRKCKRPLASGEIPIAGGTLLVPVLLLGGVAVALAVGGRFAAVILAYFAMTVAYSVHLKRRIVIDICVLAGLYAFRLVAGGVATGIELSVWLIGFSIFIFYALAAIKRQAELVDGIASGLDKVQGRGYRPEDVTLIASMAAAAGFMSVLVMALYLNSPAVQTLYGQPLALWGICLVLLYWINRMVIVTHRGRMHDDPIVFAAKDRVSQICLLLVAACVAGALLL